MVYEPSEDSYLLSEYVREHAYGKVLDMGTGSGIQVVEALKKGCEVTGVDIDPEAVKYCSQHVMGAKFIQSDLFEKVSGKFDTIIFNAPYLPMDEDDEKYFDPALFGGKEGWETIGRFLKVAGKYLEDKGKILLLFSSLSNKEKVIELILNNDFICSQIGSKKLDFEELYVYLIKRKRG